MSSRLLTFLGALLTGIAVLGALLVWLPSPVFSWWIAHFASVELGPQLALAGLGGALILRGQKRLLGVVAGILAAWPYTQAWLYTRGLDAPPAPPAGPAPTIERDVVLAGEVTADLYRPAGSGPFPLVVVVHGGSWHAGEKGEVPHVSEDLAARGALVADVHYRLAPAHPFPAPLTDVKCALGTLRARSDVDPARVFLLGRSAGGHLALMAGLTAGLPELPPACPVEDRPVTGVAAMYPTTDLVYGEGNPPSPDAIDNRGAYRELLGFSPADDPVRAAAASPVSHVTRAGKTAFLLIHGQNDRLVPVAHTERLAAALQSAGSSPVVHLLPGADHAFDHHPGGPGDVFALGRLRGFVFGGR